MTRRQRGSETGRRMIGPHAHVTSHLGFGAGVLTMTSLRLQPSRSMTFYGRIGRVAERRETGSSDLLSRARKDAGEGLGLAKVSHLWLRKDAGANRMTALPGLRWPQGFIPGRHR